MCSILIYSFTTQFTNNNSYTHLVQYTMLDLCFVFLKCFNSLILFISICCLYCKCLHVVYFIVEFLILCTSYDYCCEGYPKKHCVGVDTFLTQNTHTVKKKVKILVYKIHFIPLLILQNPSQPYNSI